MTQGDAVLHPKPAATPLVATMAVSTPSKFEVVLTAFIRFASHVRPSIVHFVVQLSPLASAFTQLTSEMQGGDEVASSVKPLPQTQAEALVEPTGLVAAVDPHGLQGGVAVGSW